MPSLIGQSVGGGSGTVGQNFEKAAATSVLGTRQLSFYKVEATPANHTGFTNVAQQLKNNVRLRGETIKEMLVAGDTSLCSFLNKDFTNDFPLTGLFSSYFTLAQTKNGEPTT